MRSQWNAQGNGDWYNSANWTPPEVPGEKASFGQSSQTMVWFSQTGASVGEIELLADAPQYTFEIVSESNTQPLLTIGGTGVVSTSANITWFVVSAASTGYTNAQLQFTGNATAGGSNVYYFAGPLRRKAQGDGAGGGVIGFCGNSNAGSAYFFVTTGKEKPPSTNSTVGGEVSFSDTASAANARFVTYGTRGTDGDTFGSVAFHAQSTASRASFMNEGGTVAYGDGGNTQFYDTATAGDAHFVNDGGTVTNANGGDTAFDGTSNAATGHFHNYAAPASSASGGVTSFNNNEPHVAVPGGASAGNGHFSNYGASAAGQGSGGHTYFSAMHGCPTAANGSFDNYGSTIPSYDGASYYIDTPGRTVFSISLPTKHAYGYFPTAGNGTFRNHPAPVAGGAAGFTQFAIYYGKGASPQSNVPTAGSGVFYNVGATTPGAEGGYTAFSVDRDKDAPYPPSSYGPTAGNGVFYNYGGSASGAVGGHTRFGQGSSAASATLFAYGGTNGGHAGKIIFENTSSGGSAAVTLYQGGELSIKDHDGGLTLGALTSNGGAVSTWLGTETTTLTLTGPLALQGTLTFWFDADKDAFPSGTYAILVAPNLSSFSVTQFAGNGFGAVQPVFSIAGDTLSVSFPK